MNETDCVLLPSNMVATAVKAVCNFCKRVFRCDLYPNVKPVVGIQLIS
jgi:hypothetical protein